MIRGASVFEDVIKTVCTTNCSWSGTVRMVNSSGSTRSSRDHATGNDTGAPSRARGENGATTCCPGRFRV